MRTVLLKDTDTSRVCIDSFSAYEPNGEAQIKFVHKYTAGEIYCTYCSKTERDSDLNRLDELTNVQLGNN